VRDLLGLLAVVSLTGMPYTVLMPVFATGILRGGPHTLGLLMGATGVGAVLGALRLAARSTVLGLGRVVIAAGAAFGAGLVLFSFSRTLLVSVPVLVVTGGGMMMQMAATNTLLQTIVPERLRGRVMSFYTMAFFGMVPFGSLVSGWAADRYGAPFAVRAGGVVTLAAVGLFILRLPALRQHIRPIYRKLGILPPIADGIAEATELAPPRE
jgi:MFS family permease